MSGLTQIRSLAARLRTLFAPGRMSRRYADGRVQVETHNGRVAEGREAFPYGFRARAKDGRALTLCQGGDPGGTVILPILGDGTGAPELGDGDVAIYTRGGVVVFLRNDGGIEIRAGAGKISIGNDTTDLCAELLGLIDDVKGMVTTGAPTSHTVLPASQAILDARGRRIENLLEEAPQ